MSDMTRKEAIKYFENGINTNLRLKEKDKFATEIANENIEAYSMAISALKGLDLPDNATNGDALNYMLRQTFPKVIFIRFHNEANLTEGVVMAKEWLSKPYKKGASL